MPDPNNDPTWMKRKAEQEDGCFVSVGGQMRDAAREELNEHLKHVKQFLSDLHATMIDPCAEGAIKVAEMMKLLLNAAVEQRQREFDQLTRIAELEQQSPHDRERIAELEKVVKLFSECSAGCPICVKQARGALAPTEKLNARS